MISSSDEKDLWSTGARDYARIQSVFSVPLWTAMLDAAHVGPGTRFLDAGCGGGGASALAAGRGAAVSGLDASESFLALAREQAPEGSFHCGDLEALPYADGSFDAVIAANALQFAGSPAAALRELRRVCEVGSGIVVVGIWGAPEECDQWSQFQAVADTLPTPDTGAGPFGLSAPGLLDELIVRAGLQITEEGVVDSIRSYPDVETCWQGQRSTAPLQRAIRQVGEATVKTAVIAALDPYLTAENGVRLKNRYRFVASVPV